LKTKAKIELFLSIVGAMLEEKMSGKHGNDVTMH
jgi:hypothetical protein